MSRCGRTFYTQGACCNRWTQKRREPQGRQTTGAPYTSVITARQS